MECIRKCFYYRGLSPLNLDVLCLNNKVDKAREVWYNIYTKRKGEKKMEIKITTSVWIDIDWIIRVYRINSNSTDEEIRDAVNDYLIDLAPLDRDLDLLSWDDILKICEEIAHRLKKEEN